MDRPNKNGRRAGFTLLELVITITMTTMAMALFAPLLSSAFNAFGTNMAMRDTVNRARPALERLMRELRGAMAVTTASGSTLTFTNQNGAAVTFDLSGGFLRRNTVNLSEGVTGLTFTQSGTSPNITINTLMTVQWQGVSLDLNGSVRLRNLP